MGLNNKLLTIIKLYIYIYIIFINIHQLGAFGNCLIRPMIEPSLGSMKASESLKYGQLELWNS
jgi:hypothetical protein